MSEQYDRQYVLKVIEYVLRKYPKARRVAVENFIISSVGNRYDYQLANLEIDAELYKWNEATRQAIGTGLHILKQAGMMR
jgi:hypothetical protein